MFLGRKVTPLSFTGLEIAVVDVGTDVAVDTGLGAGAAEAGEGA